MYIKRFAAKLDLGSKTNAVCMTALKVFFRLLLSCFMRTGGLRCGMLPLVSFSFFLLRADE